VDFLPARGGTQSRRVEILIPRRIREGRTVGRSGLPRFAFSLQQRGDHEQRMKLTRLQAQGFLQRSVSAIGLPELPQRGREPEPCRHVPVIELQHLCQKIACCREVAGSHCLSRGLVEAHCIILHDCRWIGSGMPQRRSLPWKYYEFSSNYNSPTHSDASEMAIGHNGVLKKFPRKSPPCMQSIDADLLTGAEALRKGDAHRARDHFSRALAAGKGGAPALLGLAHACAALGDVAGKVAAVDRLLAVEPRNIRGLIMKADYLAAAGDTRSATSFYLAALRSAPPREQLTTEVAAELSRAQRICDDYSMHYQSYIVDQLAQRGFDPRTSSQRFAQSVDVVLGRKQIFVQQPRYYYFPGLPQIQFYGRQEFPWLDALESATNDIRDELLGVMHDPGAFAPYVQGDDNRPRKEQAGMLNNPAWSAYFLWKNGEVVAENAARCPRTLAALQDLPLARVSNRSPSILFSLLQPGAHIPPHNGLVNTRLICHLPLIVPDGCRFRVGNETRLWERGRPWLFDDTIEHEAWNDSDQTRVILLFDVWRPELTLEERELVTALFAAIDAHSGRKPEWSI
jgi:aspartate beta-hydroxylase